jgi:hypothetical protein
MISYRQYRNWMLFSFYGTPSLPHPCRRWGNKLISCAFAMDAPQRRNARAANHGWQDTAEHCWCWPA